MTFRKLGKEGVSAEKRGWFRDTILERLVNSLSADIPVISRRVLQFFLNIISSFMYYNSLYFIRKSADIPLLIIRKLGKESVSADFLKKCRSHDTTYHHPGGQEIDFCFFRFS